MSTHPSRQPRRIKSFGMPFTDSFGVDCFVIMTEYCDHIVAIRGVDRHDALLKLQRFAATIGGRL